MTEVSFFFHVLIWYVRRAPSVKIIFFLLKLKLSFSEWDSSA